MFTKAVRSSILAVIIGGALEWYEFSLYLFLSPVIAHHYFGDRSTSTGLILTAAIFAIGFLSRPIGGLFFGHIGDRYGRKIAMLSSIIMITIPTFGIGLLPESSDILITPVLLLLIRLLQGMLTGGEMPGMVCYLTEGTPASKGHFISSLAFVGSQIGVIIAIAECIILENTLTSEQFLQWGWRLSFIIGGVIGLAGCFLRSALSETLPFLALRSHKRVSRRPILTSLLTHKKNLLIAVLLSAAPLSSDFLYLGFSSVYLQTSLHLPPTLSMFITAGFLIIVTVFLPIFGKMGDRYPTKPLFILSSIVLSVISYPLFYCASEGMMIASYVLAIISAVCMSCFYALLPFILATLFPTTIRYSCIGLSYNLSASLFGGTVPVLALLLVRGTQNPASPSYLILASSLLTLLGVYLLKEKKTIS